MMWCLEGHYSAKYELRVKLTKIVRELGGHVLYSALAIDCSDPGTDGPGSVMYIAILAYTLKDTYIVL